MRISDLIILLGLFLFASPPAVAMVDEPRTWNFAVHLDDLIAGQDPRPITGCSTWNRGRSQSWYNVCLSVRIRFRCRNGVFKRFENNQLVLPGAFPGTPWNNV
mgnify:CR=1 FL=1